MLSEPCHTSWLLSLLTSNFFQSGSGPTSDKVTFFLILKEKFHKILSRIFKGRLNNLFYFIYMPKIRGKSIRCTILSNIQTVLKSFMLFHFILIENLNASKQLPMEYFPFLMMDFRRMNLLLKISGGLDNITDLLKCL